MSALPNPRVRAGFIFLDIEGCGSAWYRATEITGFVQDLSAHDECYIRIRDFPEVLHAAHSATEVLDLIDAAMEGAK